MDNPGNHGKQGAKPPRLVWLRFPLLGGMVFAFLVLMRVPVLELASLDVMSWANEAQQAAMADLSEAIEAGSMPEASANPDAGRTRPSDDVPPQDQQNPSFRPAGGEPNQPPPQIDPVDPPSAGAPQPATDTAGGEFGVGDPGFDPPVVADVRPIAAPQFDGRQFDGPQFDGPQFDGPQFDGPQFDGPQFDGPQFDPTPQDDAAGRRPIDLEPLLAQAFDRFGAALADVVGSGDEPRAGNTDEPSDHPGPSASAPADRPAPPLALSAANGRQASPARDPNQPTTGGRPAAGNLPRPVTPASRAVVLSNSTRSRGVVHFLLDGRHISLRPGESRRFSTGAGSTIRFHRGGSFGNAQAALKQGDFEFRIGARGWELARK